jgi:hypothetical protein
VHPEHGNGASEPLELPDRPVFTLVFTIMMARELSSRTYPNIGVPEQHHAVSHHRNDPALIS